MRGRPPKRTTKLRGNWTYVRETDRVEDPPKLPRIKGVRWWAATRRWWAAIWDTPYATLYEPVDAHGLVMLAHLKQQYLRKPSNALAKEIRYQEEAYGLTPQARARLRWAVIEDKTNGRPEPKDLARSARRMTGRDVRHVLENDN